MHQVDTMKFMALKSLIILLPAHLQVKDRNRPLRSGKKICFKEKMIRDAFMPSLSATKYTRTNLSLC